MLLQARQWQNCYIARWGGPQQQMGCALQPMATAEVQLS